jgi:hypothetical protein
MNRTYDLQVGRVHMTAFGHGSYQVHASYFDWDVGLFKVRTKSILGTFWDVPTSALPSVRWIEI